jgi:hypothetical protein
VDRSGVIWIGTIVAVLVFLDLLFVELRRAYREAKRLMTRIEGYGQLPIVAQLATGERDVDRIIRAFDTLPVLIERAQRAIGVLRSYLPKGSSPG